MRQTLIAACSAALIAGCASTPPADTGPTPAEVRDSGVAQSEVHWGGQIVKVKNLRDRTLIEVLALPLDSDGEPQIDETPQGRFIVDKSGFLEPHEYASGRLVEVRGRLNGFTDGTVGDSPYRYPVVVSERVRLWGDPPSEGVSSGGPRIRPSIGVGVGSGGRSWGGVGIGIGF
ncbi:MAG: Slp family lipoprotein [Gammaproteobacteria bacterium]|nr:Slp family lipoprotein [Gammaproteobacteria bacterium]